VEKINYAAVLDRLKEMLAVLSVGKKPLQLKQGEVIGQKNQKRV